MYHRTLHTIIVTILTQFLFMTGVTAHLSAAEVFAKVGETTTFNSNVYLDDSKEWDIVIIPHGSLDVEFGPFYALGYSGFLSVYPRHSDLLYHAHDLYFLANPTWGENGENGFLADFTLTTQRNTDTFSDVNLLEPSLFLNLDISPTQWFSWSLSETVSFRWFYENTVSNALTSWTRGDLTFTTKTRTTISPRVIFGVRHYPKETLSDRTDQQLHAGLRLSQNVAPGMGLRLDYAYLHSFGESVLVKQNMDALTFHYIGEDFLFSGHRALFGFKTVLTNGFSADASLQFTQKNYSGWPVLNEFGIDTSETRRDWELAPSLQLTYHLVPSDDTSAAVPGLEISLGYTFVRNSSNDDWYDTYRHLVSLGLTLDW